MDAPQDSPQPPLLPLNQLIAIDSMMLLGIAVLCWYALQVAGFAPPVPLMPEAAEVVRIGQTQMVYILAAIGIIEYGVITLFFRRMCEANAENHGRPANPLLLRIGWAGSVWMYIIILWFTLHPEADLTH